MIQTTFLCFLLSSNFRIHPTVPLQLRCRSSWPGGVPQKLKRLSAGTIQNLSKRYWQKLLFNITIQVSKCSKNLDCFFLFKTFSFWNSSLKMVLNPTPRAHIGGIPYEAPLDTVREHPKSYPDANYVHTASQRIYIVHLGCLSEGPILWKITRLQCPTMWGGSTLNYVPLQGKTTASHLTPHKWHHRGFPHADAMVAPRRQWTLRTLGHRKAWLAPTRVAVPWRVSVWLVAGENKTPTSFRAKPKSVQVLGTKCEKNNWGIHKENLGDVLCSGGGWTKSCWKLINGSFYIQVQYQMIQLVQDPLSSSTLPPAVSSCKATQHGKRGANEQTSHF